jgi:hypothetical protein
VGALGNDGALGAVTASCFDTEATEGAEGALAGAPDGLGADTLGAAGVPRPAALAAPAITDADAHTKIAAILYSLP